MVLSAEEQEACVIDKLPVGECAHHASKLPSLLLPNKQLPAWFKFDISQAAFPWTKCIHFLKCHMEDVVTFAKLSTLHINVFSLLDVFLCKFTTCPEKPILFQKSHWKRQSQTSHKVYYLAVNGNAPNLCLSFYNIFKLTSNSLPWWSYRLVSLEHGHN